MREGGQGVRFNGKGARPARRSRAKSGGQVQQEVVDVNKRSVFYLPFLQALLILFRTYDNLFSMSSFEKRIILNPEFLRIDSRS